MDVPTFFSIRDTHTDRQTDRQTDIQTDIQTHIEFYIYRYIYILAEIPVVDSVFLRIIILIL